MQDAVHCNGTRAEYLPTVYVMETIVDVLFNSSISYVMENIYKLLNVKRVMHMVLR